MNETCIRAPFVGTPTDAPCPFTQPAVTQINVGIKPAGHGAIASRRFFNPVQVAITIPECQECEECLSQTCDHTIPPAAERGHCSAVYCGSESDLPLETRSCSSCEGAHTAAIPLVSSVTDPEPAEEALPEPIIPPPPVPQSNHIGRRETKNRSIDATLRQAAPTEIPPAPEPKPTPVPVTPQTMPKDPQAEIAHAIQAEANKYPLFESDPSAFIAEEPVPPEVLPPTPRSDRSIAAAPKATAPQGYLINFQNVSMSEYVKFVAQLTGKNFIYNSDDLQFTVTIVSKEPTTLDNIMAALLQELRIHGLALLEQGNNLIIYRQAGVVSPASLFSEETRDPQEIVTRVFPIEHVGADKISDIVARMLSDQALVQTLVDSNTLIVTDLSTNVERISQIIRVLDLPSQTFEIGQYVALNGLIADLIPLAEQILTPFSSGRPPVLVPHIKTNSVYIVASPELVKQTISVLRKLDGREGATQVLSPEELRQQEEQRQRNNLNISPVGVGFGPGGPGSLVQNVPLPFQHPSELHTKFYIHKLQFRQGDQLQDALYRIADSLRLDEQANIDLINAINSVQWLEASNALVITGTEDAVGRVKELIEELDISLRQVFLEMLILDTTIADSLQYSVDLGDQFSSQYVGSALSNNTPNPASSVFPFPVAQTAAGTIVPGLVPPPSALMQNPGFNLGIIGRRIFKGENAFTTIGALVRAIHTDEVAEIVLNPKILVEDNFPAEVFVGQNIPYATQSVVNQNSNFVTQNVDYRDVGTTLKVTPQLGNGDMITLTIEEEVSEIFSNATTTAGTASPLLAPTTNKSNTITKVHVPDGYFVILSGVIRSKTDRLRTQIPCLGGVPFLGALAGSKNNIYSKRNILIFIRPQIVDEDWKYDEVTRHNQCIYREKNKRKPRWKYETDEALDFLNLPRFDGGCPPPDWEYGGGGW